MRTFSDKLGRKFEYLSELLLRHFSWLVCVVIGGLFFLFAEYFVECVFEEIHQRIMILKGREVWNKYQRYVSNSG